MRVEFSRWVEIDLETIGDYIAADNPCRAVTFIREIREKIAQIGRQPTLYQLRPEIGEGARLAVVGRYVILLRILEDVVRIERVVYGGRDLPPLLRG
ncbi:MAG: type II toxin-antitoxin system RelE/ParE family toxin [Terracidiphilus sp.]